MDEAVQGMPHEPASEQEDEEAVVENIHAQATMVDNYAEELAAMQHMQFNVASAENNQVIRLFRDPDAEALSFPTLYGGQDICGDLPGVEHLRVSVNCCR